MAHLITLLQTDHTAVYAMSDGSPFDLPRSYGDFDPCAFPFHTVTMQDAYVGAPDDEPIPSKGWVSACGSFSLGRALGRALKDTYEAGWHRGLHGVINGGMDTATVQLP